MDSLNAATEQHADWDRLRPALDDALGELGAVDRAAILLRFYQRRSFSELGRVLSLTEEASRKRVERALERLGAKLSKRGITSTSIALAGALADQAASAASGELATTVAANAIGGALPTATVATALHPIFTLMPASKITVGIAGIVALIASGIAISEANSRRAADTALVVSMQRNRSLDLELSQGKDDS